MQSACTPLVYMSVNWHRCDGPTLCTITEEERIGHFAIWVDVIYKSGIKM